MISLNVPVDNLEIPECLICRNVAIPINSTLCFKRSNIPVQSCR